MGMTMGYALDTPDIQVTVKSTNIHLQNLTPTENSLPATVHSYLAGAQHEAKWELLRSIQVCWKH